MRQFLDIVAKTLSVILYPLFVPTYGIALFCLAHAIHTGTPLPWIWTVIAVVGTFLLSCVLPITAIWILMRRGTVSDMQIENASERTMPYIYTIMGFGFWAYLMIAVLESPLYLSCIAVGAVFAICLVALINKYWKISAHLTGFGGLVGGIFCYCLGIGGIPTWTMLLVLFTLSWVLMWARLHLNAHTPAQVCTGWLLGISCTFIPYCIISYAL